MSFRQKARTWAQGKPLADLPEEILEYKLLTKLPGYTRRQLEAEPAETVRRWMILIEELDREEARQQRLAARH